MSLNRTEHYVHRARAQTHSKATAPVAHAPVQWMLGAVRSDQAFRFVSLSIDTLTHFVLPLLAPYGFSIQRERKKRVASGDCHVLLSLYQKAIRIGVDWSACGETPERFA